MGDFLVNLITLKVTSKVSLSYLVYLVSQLASSKYVRNNTDAELCHLLFLLGKQRHFPLHHRALPDSF